MTLNGTVLMSAFQGDRIDFMDLGLDDDPRFAVEVAEPAEGDGVASIIFFERLEFHADLAQRFTPDEWRERTDADGELTGKFIDTLLDRMTGYLSEKVEGPLYVGTTEGGDSEPNITLEIGANYREGETFGEWFDRIGWPIIATLINVSDPGTFNAPYWFA